MEILYNSEIILVFSTRTCKKTLQFKPNISTALLSSWLYSSRLPHWPPRMFPPLDSAWMYANFLCTFKCGLKYIATPWKQTVILFGGNVSDSQPRRQHLNSSQTTAPKRQEGKSGYTQVCNKRSMQVWTSKTRYYWIHSFHKHLSHLEPILFPHSLCFLYFLFINNAGSFHTFRVQLSAIPLEFSRPEYWSG